MTLAARDVMSTNIITTIIVCSFWLPPDEAQNAATPASLLWENATTWRDDKAFG